MKTTDKFVFFWEGIYSNWTHAPFTAYGHSFYNSEQAFMYFKATFFEDTAIATKILDTDDPKKAKDLGRQVKGYDDTKWNEVRFEFMYRAVYYKFQAHPDLLAALLATGDRILVEASPVDKVWGIGMREDDPGVENEANWKGLNLLGKALMTVRDNIRSRSKTP